ncbi:MAG: hypothetical protein JSW06_05090 [Thermoplasmatales archaeon]|nr:MAG: hypothetical protein JSW06_05090 [Thermoplasmatales archaeon]
MNKNFGRSKAGGITKKNSVIMIVSILAVTLFIGTAIQPVIATPLTSEGAEVKEVEEVCIPCKYEEERTQGDAKCKTCVGAVFYAVRYMNGHVRDKIKAKISEGGKLIYPLWTVDLSMLFSQELIKGLVDSGFRFKVDFVDLCQSINNTVNKLIDSANYFYPVISYLAVLFVIPIGITVYLLRLCTGD